MKRILTFLFILLLPLTSYGASYWVDVDYVIDGDTFSTTDGKRVRLLGINTPEIAKRGKPGQPFANKAKQALTKLISKQRVKLSFSTGRTEDKYSRILAFVHNENGSLIQKELLKQGLAHVYTFPDTPFDATHFMKTEEQARNKKLGIWSTERWNILEANKPVSEKRIGTFNLVQGIVKNTKKVKNKIYLNFGNNWRTDFTVEIKKKHWENFYTQNIDPEKFYLNKHVLVRGFLKPVNGILVTATHPEQIMSAK